MLRISHTDSGFQIGREWENDEMGYAVFRDKHRTVSPLLDEATALD